MAIGSGIGSQFGLAPEVTYGTYVAPARFYEARSARVTKAKNTASWDGLAAGRLVDRADGRAVTTKGGQVVISDLVCTNKDMGLLLNMIMGGTVAPVVQGATAAHLQTHPLADTYGKMCSCQSGVPLVGGTVIPQTALGSKVTSATFACAVDQLLTLGVELDARDITEAQTLAAASYATSRRPFHFGQMGVKTGATVAGATVADGVRGFSMTIERNIKVDQFYANAAGLKDQPVTADKVMVTGTLNTDYKSAAHWADRFRDDSQFSLVIEFVGPIIALTHAETLRLALPAVYLDGDTPSVGGPDVVQTDFPFRAYFDMTNPALTIEYMSTDTVL
jgi:Phage tail tube protein